MDAYIIRDPDTDDGDTNTRGTLKYWFRWERPSHSPDLIPEFKDEQAGLELGATLYNEALEGVPGFPGRPFCVPGGGATTHFWTSTFQDARGFVWVSNVPEAAAPYADTNIAFDECSENSLQFGIGYPHQLQKNPPGGIYVMAVETPLGTKESSPYSISAGLVSNNCDESDGVEPNSTCMGLNDRADIPGDPSQIYVNKDRRWRVPGCAYMDDALADPVRADNGEPFDGLDISNCYPGVVVFENY